DRVQSGAGAAGEDDSAHGGDPLTSSPRVRGGSGRPHPSSGESQFASVRWNDAAAAPPRGPAGSGERVVGPSPSGSADAADGDELVVDEQAARPAREGERGPAADLEVERAED